MSFPTKTAYRQSLQQKSGQYHGTLSEHRFITRKEVENETISDDPIKRKGAGTDRR